MHLLLHFFPLNLSQKPALFTPQFFGFLGKTGQFFSKLFLNSKTSCISTSFKKRISILSHIGKKLQARQFLQNRLSEKAPGSKKFFLQNFFFF